MPNRRRKREIPHYRGLWQGTPLTFALAMVGAPPCVAMLEELRAG
ncbi:MAG: hypothetical protein ACLT74_03730 [Christensenellales bacterium]